MGTLTQRELDFLVSLKTGWRRLYRLELARLLNGGAEASDAQPEPRPMVWRIVSG
jgi:hypothetical protein